MYCVRLDRRWPVDVGVRLSGAAVTDTGTLQSGILGQAALIIPGSIAIAIAVIKLGGIWTLCPKSHMS